MKKLLFTLLAFVFATMAVLAQNYTITNPFPGDVYTGCGNLAIVYTKALAAPDNQLIEVSLNGGKTYFEVARVNTTGQTSGSVTISTPNQASTKARVRVRDIASFANAGVMSGNFTINLSATVPPFFITAPATLATYPVASTQRVTWSGPADHNYSVSYMFSTTSGWSNIANVTGRNFYDWNIPVTSTRLYLRVQDLADPCRVAYSDTLFRSSSTVPAIGLTTFNGGESVIEGETYAIRWNSNAIPAGQDTVVLSLSTDNGATWQVLSDTTPRTGNFGWTVPPITSAQALFKVAIKADPTIFDISNSAFSIEARTLQLTTRNVAGPLAGCQTYNINFTAAATSGFYQALFTTNNGVTWNPLTDPTSLGTSGNLTLPVSIPALTTTSARIAIIDPYTVGLADTTNTFGIIAAPGSTTLAVTAPVTGQFVNASQSLPVSWTTTGTVANVDVAYSKDGGLTFITFASGIANTGTTTWVVPTGQNSNDYVIRVQSSTTSCVVATSGKFQVSNAGVVGLIFPIGGEQFLNGQVQNIQWEAAGLIGNNTVTLSFSSNGGTTYTPIATVPNTGSYSWTVPAIATTQGRIRVADANNSFAQTSSPGNFQIIINNPPVVAAIPTIYLNLPANSVTILGNATDPEGGSLRYVWTQISGPSTPFLANATTKTLTASPLVVGTYVFRLTVLDNYDASSFTDATVKVNPAVNTPTAWNWVKSGTSLGNDRGDRVIADGLGNAYVVGGFNGPCSFSGLADITNSGGMDAFVAKYDSSGQQVWFRTLGNVQDDEAQGIAFLPNGNIAITGWYNVNISIPGTTVTSRGSQDVFIASITPNGDWVWLKSAGSTGVDQGTGLSVAGGELYVGGWVSGNALFGSIATTGLGDRDAFVAKYDVNGNPIWARTVGSSTRDQAFGVTASQIGTSTGVVLAGFVSGTVSIGGASYPSLGGNDAFTFACLSDGSIVGFRRFGGNGADVANQVLVGPDPTLGFLNPWTYVVGSFQNTMTLPGGPTLTSAGAEDAFVVAFDLTGATPLAFRLGSTASDGAQDIVLTPSYMWVTGYVSNLQPSGPKAFGATDIFVSRHTLTGTQLQFLQAGGVSVDYGQGIAASVAGSIFSVGKFKFSGKYGPYEIAGRGNEEFYIGRIRNAPLTNFREGDAEFNWTSGTKPGSMNLLPNPALSQDRVQVLVNDFASLSNEATVRVLDLTGREISAQKVSVYEGRVEAYISTPTEAGLYLIRLEGEGVSPVTQRLTVQ